MLKISFRNEPLFVQQMRKSGPKIVRALFDSVTRSMLKLSAYVAQQKLSGPTGDNTLSVKSGRLRGSVHAEPTTITGTTISGAVVAGQGPSHLYAVTNEVGGVSTYEIRATKARALAFVMGGKQRFFASVVRSPLKARFFMKSSQAENRQAIFEDAQQSVNKAVNE